MIIVQKGSKNVGKIIENIMVNSIYMTAVFVVLKISGAVQWNYIAVLSPIIATAVIFAALVLIGVINASIGRDDLKGGM